MVEFRSRWRDWKPPSKRCTLDPWADGSVSEDLHCHSCDGYVSRSWSECLRCGADLWDERVEPKPAAPLTVQNMTVVGEEIYELYRRRVSSIERRNGYSRKQAHTLAFEACCAALFWGDPANRDYLRRQRQRAEQQLAEWGIAAK